MQVLSTSMADDLTRGDDDDGDTEMESDTEYTYSSYHPGKCVLTLFNDYKSCLKSLKHRY